MLVADFFVETFTSNVDDLVTKPFRMLIQAAYESKEHGKKGFLVTGRIDGGVIKKGDKLEIKPIGMNVQIKVSETILKMSLFYNLVR